VERSNSTHRHGLGAPSLSGNPPPELTPEQEGGHPQITNAHGFEAVVLKPNMSLSLGGGVPHHRDNDHDQMLPPGQLKKSVSRKKHWPLVLYVQLPKLSDTFSIETNT
jgi:hypothetical protein